LTGLITLLKHGRMEIQVFPNLSRPGVGQKARRESQRPLLPLHSRHCPVLEAGSGLGFLVYPPLEPNEAVRIEYVGDGKFHFEYFLSSPGGSWETLFTVMYALPVGSIGLTKEEVTFKVSDPPITEEGARKIAQTFVIPGDLGTPPGAVTLRGASGFRTPAGWDTVYGPVLNMIERPFAPMLTVRVETDWYLHESEFRYVLQPGEWVTCEHSMPIGQVYFVPREEVTLRESSEEEIEEIRRGREEFVREKDATKVMTRYGLKYSPHYARVSRSVNNPEAARGGQGTGAGSEDEPSK